MTETTSIATPPLRRLAWLPSPIRATLKWCRSTSLWWTVALRPGRAARSLFYRAGGFRVTRKQLPGVHLGSGGLFVKGFLNVDVDWGVPSDVVGPVRKLNLADGSVGVIYASHLFEHVRRKDIARTLTEWHRVLRPGGSLYLCVPDLEVLARLYVGAIATYDEPPSKYIADYAVGVIYGGQADAFDYHYFGYSFTTLRALLKEIGFQRVERFDRAALAFAAFRDGGSAVVGDTPISLNVVATR